MDPDVKIYLSNRKTASDLKLLLKAQHSSPAEQEALFAKMTAAQLSRLSILGQVYNGKEINERLAFLDRQMTSLVAHIGISELKCLL